MNAPTLEFKPEVTFRWPSRDLSPNSRGHWSKKSKAAKAYRADCFYLTKEAGLSVDWDGPVLACITFIPPDRRKRDLDNMLASLKSGLDGMAEALKINDNRLQLAIRLGSSIGGMVKIRIERGEA